MICKVIPKIKLPRGANSVFDYSVPKEMERGIKVGQMVEIPFRNQKKEGMVLEVKSQKSTFRPRAQGREEVKSLKLKSIIKILDKKPILYQRQIEVLKWVSEYYYAPLSLVLKTFVPEIPRKLKVKSLKLKVKINGDSNLKVLKSRVPEIKKAISEIINSQKNVLFQWNDLKEKTAVYIKLIEHYINHGQQVLIILPQVTDIEFLYSYLCPKFGSKLAVLHAELSKTIHYANWVRIRENQAKIILGTRSSILAPAANLGLIIIDNEQARDHKQSEQNPRYDARRIAENLKAKKVSSSPSPRVETYYQTKTKFVKLANLVSQPRFIIKVVDMKNELLKQIYSPVSSQLEESISLTLQKNQKVVLFLDRKGTATIADCKDCGYLYKCPHCDLPLPYHETEKQLICHHCGYKTEAPLSCPSCQGSNIKFLGSGTQKVEQEIRKLFPDKKVIRIDKDAKYYRLSIDNYDIVIGTQLFFKLFPSLENLGLTSMVSSDSLLWRPDFRSDEKTFQLINKILAWSQFNKAREVIVQSYAPLHYSIKYAVTQNYEKYYQEEVKYRKQLSYPPFVTLIKLIYKSEEQKKALEEALRLFAKLQKIKNIKVIGPLTPHVYKVRRRFHQEIILKIPASFKLPASVIPSNWLVDVEPEEIL